ncbi:hypothetical protein [Cyanobacterium aponinum]|uniref:Uncharacterized protein n=1 Tax=Cyanobacterium aponinum (strain PCC 10605) TaxID=755178 RepID=K9Z4I0_CYAAP|nr:hypothetical protein [Cyanobacterium aponinum]AFZ54091.1 hypothetical protein Cyan10605_1997 [Cyanobacterium aponinum PCC 10605]
MMLSTSTVEDFFQRANWQGLKQIPVFDEEVTSEVFTGEESLKPELNFTVEKFFALNNWSGKTQVFTKPISAEEELELSEQGTYKPVYSLKMTVAEFFQRMVWQGQGKKRQLNIASIPAMDQTLISEPEKRQINVKDLSDLL